MTGLSINEKKKIMKIARDSAVLPLYTTFVDRVCIFFPLILYTQSGWYKVNPILR